MMFARRLVLASVVLTAATGAATAEDTVSGDATRGATLYSTACIRCHRVPAAVARSLNPDDPATVSALEVFLRTHHTTDDAARADLIAFLAAN
jgi:cytochrome c2